MAEYTKGDWKARENLVEVLERGIIAICSSPKTDGVLEFKANAHLIASAPEMYEALKALKPLALRNIHNFGLTHAYMIMEQVLAKAEGK